MTARQSANSPATPANKPALRKAAAKKAAPRKRAPAKAKAQPAAPPETPEAPELTAGQLLVKELSKENDPYALRFLIREAGHIADYLERLHELHSGDRDSWLKVEIGAKTVEVVVNDPLREARMQAEQLRRLLDSIDRQRGGSSGGGGGGGGDPLDNY